MAVAAGLDGVLGYVGAPHPCVTVHLLLALGMAVLGIGSVEVLTMLPLPLYGCWGGLSPYDLLGTCEGIALLPETSLGDRRNVLQCSSRSWQPSTFPGGILVGVRVVVALVAGVCLDVFGRRRSIVAWMGLYFVVAFARSFSPNAESVVFCISLEGAAAQASTLALLLLAAEGSTQKECVRSVCLVLLGHAIGVAGTTPIITLFVQDSVYSQMARSLPSLVFVLFIFTLPESARWAVCRGKVKEATLMLKKSHHVAFDPTIRHKLTALHQEHKLSLAQYGCSGRAIRESLYPLFKARRLFLVFFVFSLCGLALGCAAGARGIFDPPAYNSFEDRQIAYGITEFLALLLLGLALSRVGVKWVLVSLMSSLSVALLLTRLLKAVDVESCGGYVFFSCLGYASLVLALVWMGVGIIRLTPTHSRGAVLGMTFSLATLGNALPTLDVSGTFASWGLYLDNEYTELGMWAIVTFVGGLLTLLLPKTSYCLPDTISHMTCEPSSYEKPEEEEELQNTQL
ncbi:solute carrier family 22 member 13 [Penaeus vannamei]|uniref:solute carrier family 22 member 13 n=1 Tax=Penaeus vannamei TaxID=6689 RepID=UPI000F681007|nr:organic cation transporter protein-like [Penaeus vannamei]